MTPDPRGLKALQEMMALWAQLDPQEQRALKEIPEFLAPKETSVPQDQQVQQARRVTQEILALRETLAPLAPQAQKAIRVFRAPRDFKDFKAMWDRLDPQVPMEQQVRRETKGILVQPVHRVLRG